MNDLFSYFAAVISFILNLIGCLSTINKYDWLVTVSTPTGLVKKDAITRFDNPHSPREA
jgi:hypothetical protein